MNRIAFGLAALAVALALIFLPPAFINAQEPAPSCLPAAVVMDQIIKDGGEVIDFQRVSGAEFTHVLLYRTGDHIVMALVRLGCMASPPVRLGAAAQVVEH